MAQRERKKSRKLSTDLARKISAISVASDISGISERFGMEQTELKTIMKDILELDLNNDWEVGSEDEMSEYGDTFDDNEMSIWEEIRNETVQVTVDSDERRVSSSSTTSNDSVDSLNQAEAFHPVEINLGEVKTVLNMYQKHKKSFCSAPLPKERS